MNSDNLMNTFGAASAYSSLALFGLIAGFFYAFSVSVMPGLDRVSPQAAIESMKGINDAVQNPVFFVTFFLTPAAALLSAFLAYKTGAQNAAIFMTAAAMIYVVGGMILTVSINVSMNGALALIDPATTQAATIWSEYTERWTYWNTVRTLGSLAAMLVFAIGLSKLD